MQSEAQKARVRVRVDVRPDPQPLVAFNQREAAQRCGCSVATLRIALDSGRLRFVRIGRRLLIPAQSLDEFLLGDSKPKAKK